MDRRAWWATIHGVAKMTEVTENTEQTQNRVKTKSCLVLIIGTQNFHS